MQNRRSRLPKVAKKMLFHVVPEVAGAIFETGCKAHCCEQTATKAVKTGGQLAEKGLEFIRGKEK